MTDETKSGEREAVWLGRLREADERAERMRRFRDDAVAEMGVAQSAAVAARDALATSARLAAADLEQLRSSLASEKARADRAEVVLAELREAAAPMGDIDGLDQYECILCAADAAPTRDAIKHQPDCPCASPATRGAAILAERDEWKRAATAHLAEADWTGGPDETQRAIARMRADVTRYDCAQMKGWDLVRKLGAIILGVPYDVVKYERDPYTLPDALLASFADRDRALVERTQERDVARREWDAVLATNHANADTYTEELTRLTASLAERDAVVAELVKDMERLTGWLKTPPPLWANLVADWTEDPDSESACAWAFLVSLVTTQLGLATARSAPIASRGAEVIREAEERGAAPIRDAAERVLKAPRDLCGYDMRSGADYDRCFAHGVGCPWQALRDALDDRPTCENCGEPAAGRSTDDVPLCSECGRVLAAEGKEAGK